MMPDMRVWRCLSKIAQYRHGFPLRAIIDVTALVHAAPMFELTVHWGNAHYQKVGP